MNERRGTKDLRVLHVEDDERWCAIVEESLQAEGFQVATAKSCADAEDLFRQGHYHLLVLDMSFESGNASNKEGMSLLGQLHQSDDFAAIGVIILSGYISITTMRKAFRDYGVIDCVDKCDFDAIAFIKVVKNALAEQVKSGLDRVPKDLGEP